MKLSHNILMTLSARVALLALALVSSIVLARVLGPEGRGLFALVLLLPELARSFGLLGFEHANAVYAGLEPKGRRALVWQSVVNAATSGGILALVCIVLLVFRVGWLQNFVRGPLWLYVLPLVLVPIALVAEYWHAILRGMNRIALLSVIEVGTKVASLLVLVLFIGWLDLDVAGAVWTHAVTNVATVALMVFLLRNLGIGGKPSFDPALWKRTARFAIPAHGGTVAAYLNYRIDEFFIAALLPPRELGFYAIAVALVERLWTLPSAITTALLPHITNSRNHDPSLPAAMARQVIIWIGGACLVLFASADVLIRLLYSSAFVEAVAPLRWLLPGIFALSVGKVLVTELLAREKPLYTVWASGAAALVNIVANIFLVPRMGISGAALASSLSYSLLSLVLTWCYLRETGVLWRQLIPGRSDVSVYASLWHRPKGISPPMERRPGDMTA
jgi:O-antigen/teichoic acid export membrane protein